MISAVVLAAGRSSRMGRPKALLPFEGSTFLETILATLAAAGIEEPCVVLGGEREEIARAAPFPSVTTVVNPDPDRGMLSSVRCGVDALPPDAEAFLLWPVDHPAVRVETVRALADAYRRGRGAIVRPRHEGVHGHPVLFASTLIPELLAADPSVGARAVVRAVPERVVEVEVSDRGVVTDVDTPDDYDALTSTR